MEKIKITPKFLTKSNACKHASKQRQLLKSEGKTKTHRVEVLPAVPLWRTNNWFGKKKFGLPNPTDQDFIVLVTEILQPKTIDMTSNTKKQTKPMATAKQNRPRNRNNNLHRVHEITPAPIYSLPMAYVICCIPVPHFYRSVA